ncbi:MAG: hypothetical protein VX969_03785, partial [Verrucomicrobiota bacterium]|nr:hypothetical protein [Verrucomicrobiota bacterium]
MNGFIRILMGLAIGGGGLPLSMAKTQPAEDLATPVMSEEPPAPGKRVRQVAPEYKGTKVYHTLYLPNDWEKGKTYPVLVEYTGNKA